MPADQSAHLADAQSLGSRGGTPGLQDPRVQRVSYYILAGCGDGCIGQRLGAAGDVDALGGEGAEEVNIAEDAGAAGLYGEQQRVLHQILTGKRNLTTDTAMRLAQLFARLRPQGKRQGHTTHSAPRGSATASGLGSMQCPP